jgi:rSAM/selenodomain-associated transferase 2
MLSIIIPVYNESQGILKLLEHLCAAAAQLQAIEIIVVDGGSLDHTKNLVINSQDSLPATVRFFTSKKGRAAQMHYGAQQAIGEVLYFLHADSFPPTSFDKHIEKAIAAGHRAGCFKMRFDSRHWWLRFIAWFTKFNVYSCRGGDQSLYISKDLYHQLGGYHTELSLFEDYEFIKTLYEKHSFHVIQKTLVSSARRYHDIGIFRLQWFYLRLYIMRFKGRSISDIYTYYQRWCEHHND